jgi:flavodoxin
MQRRRFVLAPALTIAAAATKPAFSSAHRVPAIERAVATPSSSPEASPRGTSRILLAYFSRAGENYYYGDRIDLKIGNTEVIANIIASLISVDVYRIEAAEPYPEDYEETVARNVEEQDAKARPEIANSLLSLDNYDTVLLGSGIWNVRPPMIMSTFAESLDLSGKTIFPFVTYAVSGLGSTMRVYTDLCPDSTIGEGLAVQGELASEATSDVEAWLQNIGLL